ncbi:MAG TPA: VOC family protein [Candidatus Baltobacteraceae bacterium]|jgi:predicted 3-demethylubiquinone-9 3-methyltransferase (glyoxalase superfamily)|nr:VOC family protein [Candidatus Baltobacteraceae bacterium]
MQKIAPFLWFKDKAEEAANFYVSIFKDSKIDSVSRYGDAGPGPAGSAMVVDFQLEGQDFMALNGGETENAASGPAPGAIALFVNCETQAEVDRLWEKLSEGGEKMQCGWVKDKYGFVWNIVPVGLSEYLHGDDPIKAQRAMRAMLQMKKLDINELKRAYEGV